MQFIFDYVHSIFVLQDGLPGEQVYVAFFKKKKKCNIYTTYGMLAREGVCIIFET